MINYLQIAGTLMLIFLITTASLGLLVSKGKMNFKIHRAFAGITLILGIAHLLLIYIK